MSINTLCAAFHRITVRRISTAARRYYSTQQCKNQTCDLNVVSRLTSCSYGTSHGTDSGYSIKFVPGTLNIDFGMPANSGLIRNIIEMPVARIPPLQDPTSRLPIQYDSPVPEKSMDLPTSEKIFEKQAVRLIIIRRKKIKKHKRKKLRKRMKYVWAKIRLRRNQKREKEFQAGLIAKVKEAQAFDAKEYVKEKLHIINKEKIPRTYRGEILPTEMIKKFLDEKKARKVAKRNKPRLTL
ncbi:uncharacterized protein [Linepithema humile]|uniref:uncharacterized protein n=1 Tax=Linepithema humile TaxID=83485 RepID=UPI0006233C15|nr:PREDICTED: uncharacterized protein LOC105678751 [Linepithema humile]